MNSEKDHIIKSYDTELERLNGEIANMGELAVKQLEAAVELVERRDERAARHVVENDDVIDDMEHQISHDVVRLLALRAPMARDLREVFAALRVASDIERIGDYATNIAKRSIPLSMLAPVARQAVCSTCRNWQPARYARFSRPITMAMPMRPTRSGRTTCASMPRSPACFASCSPT